MNSFTQDEPPSLEGEESSHKLKMLVASLKKKYGEAVGQAYTLDTKCRELSAENSTLKQTQSALSQKFNEMLVELQTLQENNKSLSHHHETSKIRMEDAENEVQALRSQHAHLRELVQTHEEDAKKAHDDLQAVKLKEVQLERVIQFLRKRSEEAHLETTQLSQELHQTQEQAHALSDELAKSSGQVRELRETLEKEMAQHLDEKEELASLLIQIKQLSENFEIQTQTSAKFKEECQALKEELHSQNTYYDTLQKEHIFLKQAMMRSVDEVKQELAEAIKQQDLERIEWQKNLTFETDKFLNERRILEDEIEQLKSRELVIKEAEELKNALKVEKEHLKRDLEELKKQNSFLTANHADLEQRFKTAQQHLAKKVRETALGNERIESERLKTLELQNQLNLSQIKISELKNNLEMEAEHQRRSLARESELLKNSEAQLARLEEKYFQIHERWKESEAEAKELKKVEEKWQEAEKLFSKMGHFSSISTHTSTTTPVIKAKVQPDKLFSEISKIEPTQEIQVKQQSLFEEPKNPTPFRDSFL